MFPYKLLFFGMTVISQDDYLTAEAWAAYGSLKDKKNSIQKKILPFVMQYHLALSNRWGIEPYSKPTQIITSQKKIIKIYPGQN